MVLGKNIAGNSKEDFIKKAIALVASRLMQLPVVCMEYTGLSADSNYSKAAVKRENVWRREHFALWQKLSLSDSVNIIQKV